MQEDINLTTAIELARKKYSPEEEELIKAIVSPRAQIEVLIPADMDAAKFNVAISAVSKVIARSTLQAQAMFPVLGRLLFVAQSNPELWNKKHERFEDYRLWLADKFGLARQTSYDALEYAKRWSNVIPPDDFAAIGRVKLKVVSRYIGKGDEGKKTARELLEFAKEHTLDELDEHLDRKLHTGRGATKGARFKFNLNKRQEKDFKKWFNDPRVHAACGSSQIADILDHMIEECEAEWIDKGQAILDEQASQEAPPVAEAAAAE